MNRLLFLLPAAALAACQSPAPATGERPSETTGNLIIGYDPAVGIEPLLAAASDYRAEILYRYTIITAGKHRPATGRAPFQNGTRRIVGGTRPRHAAARTAIKEAV